VDAQAARRSRPLANGKGGEAAQISSSSMRTPSSWRWDPRAPPRYVTAPGGYVRGGLYAATDHLPAQWKMAIAPPRL